MLISLLCLAAVQAPMDTKTHWQTFLAQHRAEAPAGKVDLDQLLADAAAAGVPLADSAKSPFAAWAREAVGTKAGGIGRRWPGVAVPAVDVLPGMPVGGGAVPEREPNDTRAWAEPLPLGATVAVGSVGDASDNDLFVLDVVEDSVVRLQTGPGAPESLADSLLELSDEFGAVVAFSDDAPGLGLYSAIQLPLTAGRYYARVRGYADETGNYTLELLSQPVAIGNLLPGAAQPVQLTSGAPLAARRFVLDAAADVVFDAVGVGAIDPVLWVCNAQGAVVMSNDDAVGLNSRVRIGLDAGTYVLLVSDFGGASGTINLSASATAGALPSACGGASGQLAAPYQGVTFRLELTGAPLTELALTLGAGSPPAAPDTLLDLYDASWRRIASNDDALGTYSAIRLKLPPGTYYALVRRFPGSAGGSFTASANCAAVATPEVLACGETVALTLGAGGSRAYRLSPGAPVRFEARTSNGFPVALDTVAAVFGEDGRLLDWSDDADAAFNAQTGAFVPADGAWAVVAGYENQAIGTAEIYGRCPLDLFGDPVLGGSLLELAFAKTGSFVVTLQGAPGVPMVPNLLEGLLLVDLSTVTAANAFFSPTAGSTLATLGLPSDPALAGTVVRYQTAVLDPDRASGWLSNAVDVQF